MSLILRSICLCLVLFPLNAFSARLSVDTRGVDSSSCGQSSAPCRSISQAIANANNGDTVVVGPGRYGDLNGNGQFGDEGEEFGSDDQDAVIVVNKPLRIVSSDGAGSTIINGKEAYSYVIRIVAPSVILGGLRKGFSVLGGAVANIHVDASQTAIRGNRIRNQVDGSGIAVGCNENSPEGIERGRIVDNSISAAVTYGIELCNKSFAWTVFRNDSSLNFGDGIFIEGSGHTIRGNSFNGNTLSGVRMAAADVKLTKNKMIGNGSGALRVSDQSITVTKNDMVGNIGFGIFTGPSSDAITRNNIYGNRAPINQEFPQCGLFFVGDTGQDPDNMNTNLNYWGASEGTTAATADKICSNVSFDNKDPKARKKPFKISVSEPRN